ncbi:DUF58 domain-containing protein [Haloferax mediterranei ATCC 33500]|uniref:DUF58 domain-containing protein n=1 Tax=Haloferax mediterranei (strain ATCC 33500 / DSM 1411 / JCM 8866 / NBRC 14739 / NCIMB 2177 / R-4) TaxID=523841 RepID=I3R669_HALMT|nr:DUF58 domain-containing protein [Haloferax mediterranei]AFK19729.2 hypothetical protein HFX_2036 [Haloferax mediterranei ATCC 33500]AHZ23116.1 hypothetical protein BM92_10925 [Haloferax mediterranei ATCC 33500]EMA00050.1 hypothetical protein C439_11958 [Haloferax mediterranei ATCC 33500]MDX5987527.1 DUF58 domain-containing protein [Haloferax mediterranei ATCC 33500]QCQ74025.1 DUF58 domain-containing protein [Haloferax mediterranei ATCC 33500]
MRLTRRGWVALVVVVLGVVNAVAFGPRALNAVVIPVVVALVVGAVQVWRASPPRVVRDPPDDGFPGETHTVSLTIEADRAFPATTTDALSDGLSGEATIESVVGDGRRSYDVTYRARGPATIGPVTIVAHDLLSLFSKSFTVGETTEVLVFPRVRSLTATARRNLSALVTRQLTDDRDEFDRLREYVPGDSLRDIHWKSSAKSGDLVVKAYNDRAASDAVAVSVGTSDGYEDDVAEAAATLCCSLLDVGIPVRLTTPAGIVDAAPGDGRRILAHLSRMRTGVVPDETAEVVVRGDAGRTHVRIAGRETTFDQLRVSETTDTGASADGRSGDGGIGQSGRHGVTA